MERLVVTLSVELNQTNEDGGTTWEPSNCQRKPQQFHHYINIQPNHIVIFRQLGSGVICLILPMPEYAFPDRELSEEIGKKSL